MMRLFSFTVGLVMASVVWSVEPTLTPNMLSSAGLRQAAALGHGGALRRLALVEDGPVMPSAIAGGKLLPPEGEIEGVPVRQITLALEFRATSARRWEVAKEGETSFETTWLALAASQPQDPLVLSLLLGECRHLDYRNKPDVAEKIFSILNRLVDQLPTAAMWQQMPILERWLIIHRLTNALEGLTEPYRNPPALRERIVGIAERIGAHLDHDATALTTTDAPLGRWLSWAKASVLAASRPRIYDEKSPEWPAMEKAWNHAADGLEAAAGAFHAGGDDRRAVRIAADLLTKMQSSPQDDPRINRLFSTYRPIVKKIDGWEFELFWLAAAECQTSGIRKEIYRSPTYSPQAEAIATAADAAYAAQVALDNLPAAAPSADEIPERRADPSRTQVLVRIHEALVVALADQFRPGMPSGRSFPHFLAMRLANPAAFQPYRYDTLFRCVNSETLIPLVDGAWEGGWRQILNEIEGFEYTRTNTLSTRWSDFHARLGRHLAARADVEGLRSQQRQTVLWLSAAVKVEKLLQVEQARKLAGIIRPDHPWYAICCQVETALLPETENRVLADMDEAIEALTKPRPDEFEEFTYGPQRRLLLAECLQARIPLITQPKDDKDDAGWTGLLAATQAARAAAVAANAPRHEARAACWEGRARTRNVRVWTDREAALACYRRALDLAVPQHLDAIAREALAAVSIDALAQAKHDLPGAVEQLKAAVVVAQPASSLTMDLTTTYLDLAKTFLETMQAKQGVPKTNQPAPPTPSAVVIP